MSVGYLIEKEELTINPPVGIGDMLIEKMKESSNNIRIKKIIIKYEMLRDYRKFPEKALNNMINLINLLFDDCEIEINRIKEKYKFRIIDIIKYPLKNPYIYDLISHKLSHINVEYENYIIFHTKARMFPFEKDFLENDLPKLDVFLNDFRTDKKIIICGERNIENNVEGIGLKIISLYNYLIKLGKNNVVIDLTYDELYSGQEDFEKFLYDVKLINNAEYNINIGLGGTLTMIQAFSKNKICFYKYDNSEKSISSDPVSNALNFFENCGNVYDNIEQFLNKINVELSIS